MIYNERGIWGGTSYSERKRLMIRTPEYQRQLVQEAVQLGLYENRYSIVKYIESLHAARQCRIRIVESPPVAPELLLSKFQELSAGWSNLLESSTAPIDQQDCA